MACQETIHLFILRQFDGLPPSQILGRTSNFCVQKKMNWESGLMSYEIKDDFLEWCADCQTTDIVCQSFAPHATRKESKTELSKWLDSVKKYIKGIAWPLQETIYIFQPSIYHAVIS